MWSKWSPKWTVLTGAQPGQWPQCHRLRKCTVFLGSNYGWWQYGWGASVTAPPPITAVRDRSTETSYRDKLTCLFIFGTVHSKLLVVGLLQSSQPMRSQHFCVCVCLFYSLSPQLGHSLSCMNCSNSSCKLQILGRGENVSSVTEGPCGFCSLGPPMSKASFLLHSDSFKAGVPSPNPGPPTCSTHSA